MILAFAVLIVLIFFSAFFSGIELAFLSLSEVELIEIEQSENKNKKILLSLLENREHLLSTILIGNNITNIAASALNTTLAIQAAPFLGLSGEVSVSCFAIGLTVIILLLGEITPKTIAIAHNKTLSLFFSPLILFLSKVFFPASYFFQRASRMITRIFGTTEKEVKISESTVINVVNMGQEQGVINETESELIQNVFLFDQREVNAIMIPRKEVFALEESQTLAEVQEELLDKNFSRIPVYSEIIDNIIGVINLKAIIPDLLRGNKETTLATLMQKPMFIYETLPLKSLLEQFKVSRNHMAIVVDEFGGLSGIVTMEDILEELVGEIFDEKDEVTYEIKKIGEKKWLVKGIMDLPSINKEINRGLIADDEYSTLQGLIMSNLERIPAVGESLLFDGYKITVMRMEGNEIKLVMLDDLEEQTD